MSNNCLTHLNNIDLSKIRISDAVESTVPVVSKRVSFSIENANGSISDLIIPTESCFSFGISQTETAPNSGVCNGYKLQLYLHSQNPSQAERDWVDNFNTFIEWIKTWLIENKDKLGLFDLERSELKKFNPLYIKKDKGKPIVGAAPQLYVKLLTKNDKATSQISILSRFYNEETGQLIEDPLTMIGQRCNVSAAIKFDSIFIAGTTKIFLQLKVLESNITYQRSERKRILPETHISRPVAVETVSTAHANATTSSELLDSDDGSINGDDTPTRPNRIIRRVNA